MEIVCLGDKLILIHSWLGELLLVPAVVALLYHAEGRGEQPMLSHICPLEETSCCDLQKGGNAPF